MQKPDTEEILKKTTKVMFCLFVVLGILAFLLIGSKNWWTRFLTNIYNPTDRITVAAYGSEFGIGKFIAHNDSIKELADEIKKLKKYQENSDMPIELMSCYVGKGKIPQILANFTERTVIAYKGCYRPGLKFGFGRTEFDPKPPEEPENK